MTHTPTEIAAMIERLKLFARIEDGGGSCDLQFQTSPSREAAAMLRAVASERDKTRAAIESQASAIRNLRTNEESEINILRSRSRDHYIATATLDSEREANARLTDALLAAEAEAAALREALKDAADLIDGYVEFLRRMPSRYLEEHPYIPTVEDVLDRCHAALKENHDGL